jgi:4'-phosphopantetheinyl transferase
MPLLESNIPGLHLWQNTETVEELLQLFPETPALFDELASDKRKREFLVTRHLLQTFAIAETLTYNQDGKPVLASGKGISISNDSVISGIYLRDEQCGLDIQTKQEKLFRIAPKMCNAFEQARYTDLDSLCLIWCAKEAVFKYYGTQVPFAESMTVTEIIGAMQRISIQYKGVHGSKHFSLQYVRFQDTFVVITI